MDSDSENSGYSSSDNEEYETCCTRGGACALPFDVSSLETVVLALSDKFDFRVIMNNDRARNAMMVTTGLAIAGSLIGKHYGGKMGAALGGAVGGVCGLGIVAISLRDIWDEIKPKLSDLFDLVFDYLAGFGINDYKTAIKFITSNPEGGQLANIIIGVLTDVLGKKVVASITAA